jgi:heme/copper-type cytochrome/quinol oxidase subunit 2
MSWVVKQGSYRINSYIRLLVKQRGSMKKIAKRFPLSILTLSLLIVPMLLSLARPVRAQNQDIQVIEVTAKKYEYSNSPIHVKAGTKVQLKITAADHDHGFKVGTTPDGAAANGNAGLIFTSAQDCWLLKKGETTTIEFVAHTPGTYTFRCCHTCGLGHRGMKGQIVVE